MDFKLTKSDIYFIVIFFLVSIPIGFMDYEDYDEKYLVYVDVTLYIIMSGFSGYVLVFVIFAKFFPARKIILLFIWAVLFLFFMGAIEIHAYCYWHNCQGDPWTLKYLYYGFNSHIEEVGIFASMLTGKKLYDTQVYFFKMEKEKKENELRFLKSQIDPHFLFNNLNTVDSLIDSNPAAAKVYLNKLSMLYRYLISSKDHEVVPLEEELEFAKNYIYLIDCRFGEAFQFEITNELGNIDQQLIPPGALQTLLENIVKHNHASSEQPIKSEIVISEKGIRVSNNLSAKNKKVYSTGIGLSNLKARYKLLTDNDIEVQTSDHFIVQLPLIKQVV